MSRQLFFFLTVSLALASHAPASSLSFPDLLALDQGGFPGAVPAEVGVFSRQNGSTVTEDFYGPGDYTGVPPNTGMVTLDGSLVAPVSGGSSSLVNLSWDTSTGIQHDWNFAPVAGTSGDGRINTSVNMQWYYSATTEVSYTLEGFWNVDPTGFGPNDVLSIPTGWTATTGGFGFTETGTLRPQDGIQQMSANLIQIGGPASSGSFTLRVTAVPEPSTWALCGLAFAGLALRRRRTVRSTQA